jgi:hypothetical protein
MLHCRHIKTTLTVTNSQPSVGYLTTTFYDSSGYLYVTKKSTAIYSLELPKFMTLLIMASYYDTLYDDIPPRHEHFRHRRLVFL